MIQMVGPSDNDYIYIDFKDFKYNQKLEFPRENLELGTGFWMTLKENFRVFNLISLHLYHNQVVQRKMSRKHLLLTHF